MQDGWTKCLARQQANTEGLPACYSRPTDRKGKTDVHRENLRSEPAPVFRDVRLDVNVSKRKMKRKAKRKRSGSKTTPGHPRDLADLAALVLGNLTTDDPGSGTLMVFVWRGCAMTVKFPSDRRIYAPPGHEQSLDSTVHQIAAEIRVHMVPSELSTGEQIQAWLQALPRISIRVVPPKEIRIRRATSTAYESQADPKHSLESFRLMRTPPNPAHILDIEISHRRFTGFDTESCAMQSRVEFPPA